MDENYITLKWGTLKAWNFEGNEKANKIMRLGLHVRLWLKTTLQSKRK